MTQELLFQAEAQNLSLAAAPLFSNELLHEIHEGKKNHLSRLCRNHTGFEGFFQLLAG